MNISLIWAQGRNGVIGNRGQLPWKLLADMVWFKEHTLYKPIVMGRVTHQSIGRPLPNRFNIVLSKNTNNIKGCIVVKDHMEAISLAQGLGAKELMVIGGAKVYQKFLPLANKLYVTCVDYNGPGDVFFPEINWPEWEQIFEKKCPADRANPLSCSFKIFQKSQE